MISIKHLRSPIALSLATSLVLQIVTVSGWANITRVPSVVAQGAVVATQVDPDTGNTIEVFEDGTIRTTPPGGGVPVVTPPRPNGAVDPATGNIIYAETDGTVTSTTPAGVKTVLQYGGPPYGGWHVDPATGNAIVVNDDGTVITFPRVGPPTLTPPAPDGAVDPATGNTIYAEGDGTVKTTPPDDGTLYPPMPVWTPVTSGGTEVDPATGNVINVAPDGTVTTTPPGGVPIVTPPPPETPLLGYMPPAGAPFDVGTCMVALGGGTSALLDCANAAVRHDAQQLAANTPADPGPTTASTGTDPLPCDCQTECVNPRIGESTESAPILWASAIAPDAQSGSYLEIGTLGGEWLASVTPPDPITATLNDIGSFWDGVVTSVAEWCPCGGKDNMGNGNKGGKKNNGGNNDDDDDDDDDKEDKTKAREARDAQKQKEEQNTGITIHSVEPAEPPVVAQPPVIIASSPPPPTTSNC